MTGRCLFRHKKNAPCGRDATCLVTIRDLRSESVTWQLCGEHAARVTADRCSAIAAGTLSLTVDQR